jgi:hypothetical protein
MPRMNGLTEIATFEDGGAVIPATVYQVVAVPEDLCLWIRGYEYSDWQVIYLKALFTGK